MGGISGGSATWQPSGGRCAEISPPFFKRPGSSVFAPQHAIFCGDMVSIARNGVELVFRQSPLAEYVGRARASWPCMLRAYRTHCTVMASLSPDACSLPDVAAESNHPTSSFVFPKRGFEEKVVARRSSRPFLNMYTLRRESWSGHGWCHREFDIPGFWHPRAVYRYPREFVTSEQNSLSEHGIPNYSVR